jgi:tRNA nucleotidyltransferase (CCA-adding enzyme)
MKREIQKVLQQVLEQVTPSQEQREKIERLAEKLRQKISQTAEEMGVEAKVRVEGSVAKDTWLSEEPEIDIFMQVSPELPRETLGGLCLRVAKKATEGAKHIERFAEHPYLETFIQNVRVNIVPCYQVKRGEWKSATDRTPYHTDYVKQRLDEELRSEVRLLKRFMKGIDVYGAEIKIGGFSGYLCELFIIYHGNFVKVLEKFAEWNGRTVIDIEGYYLRREDELPLLFPEPLVVVDPVDAGRNVAAAVRREKADELVIASRAFLRKPNKKFFYPPSTKPFNQKAIRRIIEDRGSTLLFITFGKVDTVPDILWGQLYKTQKSLHKTMERHDFQMLRTSVWSNENDLNIIVFELEQAKLPAVKKHLGPPLEKKSECEKFLIKHLGSERTVCGPFVEKGRWVVEIRRRENDAVKLLCEKLKGGGRNVGVAEKIAQTVKKGFNILLNEEILDVYRSNREFAEFLTSFLVGKPKWLE